MKIRILIVDDHYFIRNSLRSLLAKERYLEVVGEARDGQEAFEAVMELAPDVVVMDLDMPTMGGVEATRRILTAAPATRIIGFSIFSTEKDESAIRRAGAVEFVPKDAGVRPLLEAIRSAAAQHPSIAAPLGRAWERIDHWCE